MHFAKEYDARMDSLLHFDPFIAYEFSIYYMYKEMQPNFLFVISNVEIQFLQESNVVMDHQVVCCRHLADATYDILNPSWF